MIVRTRGHYGVLCYDTQMFLFSDLHLKMSAVGSPYGPMYYPPVRSNFESRIPYMPKFLSNPLLVTKWVDITPFKILVVLLILLFTGVIGNVVSSDMRNRRYKVAAMRRRIAASKRKPLLSQRRKRLYGKTAA